MKHQNLRHHTDRFTVITKRRLLPSKLPTHIPDEFLTPEQAATLLRSCEDPLVMLHLVLPLFAGLRAGETTSLNWRPFRRGESIAVAFEKRSPSAVPGCQCIRVVPISEVLNAWLEPFYDTNAAVFTDAKVRQRVGAFLSAAGIRDHLILRYAFLTYSFKMYQDDLREWSFITDVEFKGYPFKRVTNSAVEAMFSLTPAAIGIKDWPKRVARALQNFTPAN